MPKRKRKSVKFSPEEMAYDLPAEIDLKELRRIGAGTETVKRLTARSRRVVGLDPDVAKVFPDAEAVNGMLRAIIVGLPK
jgi:D-serine dehydratase